MIGCAGAVAEMLWDDGGLSWLDLEDSNTMSATDWECCQCLPGEPTKALYKAVDDTERLIRDKWELLCKTARVLIVDGIIDTEYLKFKAAA
jgi:hypothetical protein